MFEKDMGNNLNDFEQTHNHIDFT